VTGKIDRIYRSIEGNAGNDFYKIISKIATIPDGDDHCEFEVSYQ